MFLLRNRARPVLALGALLTLLLVGACATSVVSQRRSAKRAMPSGKRQLASWYKDISKAPLDKQSSQIISWLGEKGWGLGRFQIDFSMEVLLASKETPLRQFIPNDDFYTDCDRQPVPVPAIGALEGETGYECKDDGDCHLIVLDLQRKRLYEMWRANIVGNKFSGGCLVVWDLARRYGPNGRGLDCTSADAAGLPITPLLFTPTEVAGGAINHAIRFILPNSSIRNGVYVAPATHSTASTSAPTAGPAYGARFRLRADYPVESLPSKGAQVVARALQRYGMILADAGNVVLTARSDRYSQVKWKGLLGPHDLRPLKVSDFEVVDGGERIRYRGDCQLED